MVNCFSLIVNDISSKDDDQQNKDFQRINGSCIAVNAVMHGGESFQHHRNRTESIESFQSLVSPSSATLDQNFHFPPGVKDEFPEDGFPHPDVPDVLSRPPPMTRQYSIGTVIDVISQHDINDISDVKITSSNRRQSEPMTITGTYKVECIHDNDAGFPVAGNSQPYVTMQQQWSPISSNYSTSPDLPFENYQGSPAGCHTPQYDQSTNTILAMSPPDQQMYQQHWDPPSYPTNHNPTLPHPTTCPTLPQPTTSPALSTINFNFNECGLQEVTDTNSLMPILHELDKIDRRRIRNNEACKKSRMRRKQRNVDKEREAERLATQNHHLKRKISMLQSECDKIRRQVLQARQ
ncbi:transcription factor protein [Ciona intestinalis]